MNRDYFATWLFVLILFAFMGCEDQITTSCDNDDNSQNFQPLFQNVQKEVFTPFCVGCHGGSSPQGNLDLSAPDSYSNLVNANASSSGKKRIVPEDPQGSYLLDRINGIGGAIMPPSGKLNQDLIYLVEKWIIEGAQNN